MSDLPAPADSGAKHPGDRLASYFEWFFKTVVGVSTLGASITFSKIVQTPVPPFHPYGFSTRTIQYLIATSWLLFILALAFTSFFASALSLWRPQAVAAFGTQNSDTRRQVLWVATFVSVILFGLAIAAFTTLSLIVTAYAGPVGWVAVAFTALFGVLGLGTIIWQSPLEWPGWLLAYQEEAGDAFEKHTHLHGMSGRREEGDNLTALPKRRTHQYGEDEKRDEITAKGRYTSNRYDENDYGHRRGSRYVSTGYNSEKRYSRREADLKDVYDVDRSSKSSTVTPDVYEVGRYGQTELIYDDGIREGLVVGRYD